jgi:hypothetical protein
LFRSPLKIFWKMFFSSGAAQAEQGGTLLFGADPGTGWDTGVPGDVADWFEAGGGSGRMAADAEELLEEVLRVLIHLAAGSCGSGFRRGRQT